MSIFDHIPAGYDLRPVQIKILSELEANWDKYDVMVVPAMVGSGKSVVAIILSAWLNAKGKTSAIVTPQVVLQEQYHDDFPDVPMLKGKGRYACESAGNCEKHYDFAEQYCEGCPYVAARHAVRRAKQGIFNFSSYLYSYKFVWGKHNKEDTHNIATYALIADEAHNLMDALADHYSWRLYKKDVRNYNKVNTIGEALVVMEGQLKDLEVYLARLDQYDPVQKEEYRETKRAIGRLAFAIEGIQRSPKEFFFDKKKSRVGEYIHVLPINFSSLQPHILRSPKKIVLMSGTINHLDVNKLGLGSRAVYRVECPSAIEASRRPVIFQPAANMGYKHQDISVPIMAKALLALLDKHPTEKGLIHMPYQLAEKFRGHLSHPRLLWHEKGQDKEDKYDLFRASQEPLVLVASGMAEGIDLPYDAGRWQAIVKVQYPSLGDPLMQYYSQKEKDYYSWLTIRTITQQSGRICRTPTDYGCTYILDVAFENLIRYNRKLFPAYFLDALKVEKKNAGNSDGSRAVLPNVASQGSAAGGR